MYCVYRIFVFVHEIKYYIIYIIYSIMFMFQVPSFCGQEMTTKKMGPSQMRQILRMISLRPGLQVSSRASPVMVAPSQ